MNNRKDNEQEQPKDINLDVPSEANTQKHVNFREQDENDTQNSSSQNSQENTDQSRRAEWQEGLEEGKNAANERRPFAKRDLNEDETY